MADVDMRTEKDEPSESEKARLRKAAGLDRDGDEGAE
jgi:hypothetical protein